MAFAQLVYGDLELLLFDVVILLVLGAAGETLPRETASQEVQQHMTNSFKIISSGLFVPNVSIDTSISGSTSEIFTLPEGDVLAIGVLIAFSKTEINDENIVLIGIVASNQEIVRLNVTMNDALFVDLLNSLNLFK